MLFFIFLGNNFYMKKFIIFVMCLFVVLSIIGLCYNKNYTSLSNSDYLRIHIRANSNSDIDQDIKYVIKDKIVDYLAPKLASCKTKDEVICLVQNEKLSLENLTDKILAENNFNYCAKIKLDTEKFPTRTYDGYTLESGIYDAMIVELGSASGNNWWCVIYPPLCFTNFSDAETTKIVYKSKILEIIKQFFS